TSFSRDWSSDVCSSDLYRNAFLYNSCLFCSNFFQSIAQKLRVVQTYICNNRNFRRYYVRAVQPTAHSHFNNGDVNFFLSEIIKRSEERRVGTACGAPSD